MMMEFTSDNVEAAVIEFYKNQGKVNSQCHEWLKSCQSSREAWQVVWPLLDPSKNPQVQFVSANMIHHKVLRCINEIPEEELPALKERLIATVAKYIAGPEVVLTRLGLTLGAFVTNTIGSTWVNPLEDISTIFSPQNFPGVPEENVFKLLVQIFGFIPEQAQSQWQHSTKKGQAYKELQGKGQGMFSWLFNVVKTQQNMEVVIEALKAMNSWMKMICICEWPDLSQFIDVLVLYCATSINTENERLTELTLDILSGVISDPNAHQYPTVILLVLDKILPLQTSLDIILQKEDAELATSFYGMYVALADCHSKLIVEVSDPENTYSKSNPRNRENCLTLINILLKCTGSPGIYPIDELVSSITISVWYSFVEDIQNLQSEKLQYVRIMQVFDEVYKSLAKILIRKAQYPPDFGEWNSEEKEQFRIYRQDVCDCITYCFELRGWTMLNEIVDWAEVNLQAAESDPRKMTLVWPELESLMMGIRAVAENILDETDPVVVEPMKRVFSVIERVLKFNRSGCGNPKLFQAAIECISSCSGMIHLYESVLKNIIGFILEGLFQPEVLTSAALALKTLSRDCSRSLVPYTSDILNYCKQALDSGRMSSNDSIRIVYCIGRFLPFLPTDQIITAVNEIFAPCLSQLQTLAAQEAKSDIKQSLIGILNIFGTLCASLDGSSSGEDDDEDDIEEEISEGMTSAAANNNNNSSQSANQRSAAQTRAQPLIPVVEQILPSLVPVAEKWSKDEDVMDALFSIPKHTLSTIHSSSPTVMHYSMQLVAISFRLNPQMCATALAKQTLMMLGKEEFATQCRFLAEIHQLVAERVKENRDMDFTESYLQMIAQLIKNYLDLVNAAGVRLEPLLQFSTTALISQESAVLKAAIFLLTIVIQKANDLRPPLLDYFKVNGSIIVRQMLLAIGHVIPRSNCANFSELFLALNKAVPGESRAWLSEALAVDGFPSVHANPDSKTKFYLKITKERANKRAIQDAINEFTVVCRNMAGTEYAAATSKRI